ncbi:hypothetical protein GGU11DRAFT_751644 [Lentinula aff. detonsa]|nr:hypothetical protein GGU11DRAFT_751644 [Lentinula aff. detonsa]
MYSKGKRKRTHLELLQHEYQSLSSSETSTQSSLIEAQTFLREDVGLSIVPTPTVSGLPSSSTSVDPNIDSMLVDRDDFHTSDSISGGTDWSQFTRGVIDDLVDHVSSEYINKEGPSRLIVPKFMKHEGLQACFRATKLKKDLEEFEARVLADREEAQCITRLEATAILEDAAAMVQELESSLKNWRSLYPNDSPIQIDNASAFVDPNKTYLIPTLMAYSLVLSQRIFSGASELSTNATLQVMRLYGSAVAALGGKATLLQQRALEAIPSQVETVENRFNLRIETTTYAIPAQTDLRQILFVIRRS